MVKDLKWYNDKCGPPPQTCENEKIPWFAKDKNEKKKWVMNKSKHYLVVNGK